jgi:hypothetical protein
MDKGFRAKNIGRSIFFERPVSVLSVLIWQAGILRIGRSILKQDAKKRRKRPT